MSCTSSVPRFARSPWEPIFPRSAEVISEIVAPSAKMINAHAEHGHEHWYRLVDPHLAFELAVGLCVL